METILESAINLISENTRIEGKIVLDQVARIHGTLIGDIVSLPGSTLILSETAVVEGTVQGDTVIIDGYVHGEVTAKSKITVSGTGRVIGNLNAPTVSIDFGAYFEGNCQMESASAPNNPRRDLSPAP